MSIETGVLSAMAIGISGIGPYRKKMQLKTFDFRSRTRPVRHRYIQIAWAQACEEAGYKGEYQLRDLRKKGLTDEFLAQGENNKGGHETEAMRKHYRLIRPPERSKSTLKSPRDTE